MILLACPIRWDRHSRLTASPVIAVPTITLEGDANGAPHLDAGAYTNKFSGKYAHRIITGGGGHNLPQEAPADFAQAIMDVDGYEQTAHMGSRSIIEAHHDQLWAI